MRGGASRGPAHRAPAGAPASGWYPDPDDPASMRHWNGRRWGGERRPRPGWAPPTRATAAPVRPVRRRRWPAVAVVATVVGLLVVAVGATLGSGPEIPPPSITDAVFAARAGELCDEVMPSIRADRPDTGPENGLAAEEVAPRIERAADGLDDLVARLDALAVAPADQAEVDRWLTDWRAYIAVGRRYAATLRAGDASTTAETGAETGRIGDRIFGFAQANDIATCRP